MPPVFHLLAGPNGAGKSTLYRALVKDERIGAAHVVALADPQRLLERVRRRVSEGGHDVPPDRILARYPRTLANLSMAVDLATVAYLYEAREQSDGGPYMVAMRHGKKETAFVKPLPAWARQILGEPVLE